MFLLPMPHTYLDQLPVLVSVAAFTITGFRNWKKATGKNGVLHANSVSHKSFEAL